MHTCTYACKQDPNLERYAAEEFAGQVFATDAVLAHLMTCARSVSVGVCRVLSLSLLLLGRRVIYICVSGWHETRPPCPVW